LLKGKDMGDSRQAYYDDWDDYQDLCNKHNERFVDVYSDHHKWLEEFDKGQTKLRFEDYKKNKEDERLIRKQESLRDELRKITGELSR
jgi:hypothetical protein